MQTRFCFNVCVGCASFERPTHLANPLFAGIRHLGGRFIRTIGQARADVAMTLMAACYNIKRLAMFMHQGVDPFYKSATA